MNDFQLTDVLLDRLVDGELPGADYQQLLLKLDANPRDWRRVGLAFLEAQALRGELAAAIAPPAPAVVHPPRKIAPLSASWFVTTAAAVFLAFAAGWLFHQQPDQSSKNVVAAAHDPTDQAANHSPQLTVRKPVTAASMHLKWDGGEVEVPIYERDSVNLQDLWATSASKADEFVAAAEERGQQVVREWELIPVELQDGREAVVPVESIKPVPNKLVTY